LSAFCVVVESDIDDAVGQLLACFFQVITANFLSSCAIAP
jgi:hypothetical protein